MDARASESHSDFMDENVNNTVMLLKFMCHCGNIVLINFQFWNYHMADGVATQAI